jgi:plastocyanin
MDRRSRAVLLGVALFMIGLLAATVPSSTSAADNAVSIVDFAFQPKSVTIAAGSAVTWTNKANRAHTVTADDGSFDSGDLASNDSFANVFDAAGTFSYHCSIHPQMTATVVVKAAAATRSPSGSPRPTPPPGTLPPSFGLTPTPSASVGESVAALPSPSSTAPAPADSSGSSSLTWIVLAILAAIVIAAVMLLRRARR